MLFVKDYELGQRQAEVGKTRIQGPFEVDGRRTHNLEAG